jgi:hypothetical protein
MMQRMSAAAGQGEERRRRGDAQPEESIEVSEIRKLTSIIESRTFARAVIVFPKFYFLSR